MNPEIRGELDRTSLLPERVYFVADPLVSVARPALCLTLYLDEPVAWAQRYASELFRTYLERIEASGLWWYTTSKVGREWVVIDPDMFGELVRHLETGGLSSRVRHLFHFRCADDPAAPSHGFEYREIDPALSRGQKGYIQLYWPWTASSDELLSMAIEAANLYPIWVGLGGFAASWNRSLPRNAFKPIFAWCRRCLGLDVRVPDTSSYQVSEGLPSVSWLTLVGHGAREAWGLDLEAFRARDWKHEVGVLPLATATLFRAGPRPELGDVNLLEYPAALAEVSQALEPFLIEDARELPGQFGELEQTAAWMRRFSFPEDWT